MYYSTTSILPQRPGKHNNARIKFLDALFKKMAKDQIRKKTKIAAKSVKRSVARLTKVTIDNKNRNSNVYAMNACVATYNPSRPITMFLPKSIPRQKQFTHQKVR